MGPLDFLKQKVSQGLSDVEQWGSDAGNAVTSAVKDVFNVGAPSSAQTNFPTPGLKQTSAPIAPPTANPALNGQQNQVIQQQSNKPASIVGQTKESAPVNIVQNNPSGVPLATISKVPPPEELKTTSNGGGYLTPRSIANTGVQLAESIPKGIINAGKAAYYAPEAVAGEIAGKNATPAELAAPEKGLAALNQSYLAPALSAPEKFIANNIPTASAAAQAAGFNPHEQVAPTILKSAFGVAGALAPAGGLEYAAAKVPSLLAPVSDATKLAGAQNVIDAVKAGNAPDATEALTKAPTPPTKELTTPTKTPAVRDADAERVVQQTLQNGGTRADASAAYKEAHPELSDQQVNRAVSRVAQESNLPLRPNEYVGNPEEGAHTLPSAQPGDYEQAAINKQRIDVVTDHLLGQAKTALSDLSDKDRGDFEDYLEKTKDINEADDPDKVQKAIDASKKLTDTGNEFDHQVGGTTPHVKDYFPGYVDHTDPEQIAKDELQAEQDLEEQVGPAKWATMSEDEKRLAINNRLGENAHAGFNEDENYGGYKNQKREFANRAERRAAKVKDVYDDPRDALTRYAQGLKYKVGNQAFIKAAKEADIDAEGIPGKTVDVASGQRVSLSDRGYKALKSNDFKNTGNVITKANRGVKQALISLGVPHAIIIPQRAEGAATALRVATALKTGFGETARDMAADADKPIKADIVEFGSQIDSPLHGERINAGVDSTSSGAKYNPLTIPKRIVYDHLLPAIHSDLLTAAKEYMDANKIDYDSAEARNLGHQINDVMGYSKNGNGLFDQSLFAPSLIKSTANIYAKSFTDGAIVARGGVAGQQLFNQAMGFISKQISNQLAPKNKSKDNFWSTVLKETVDPSLYTPFRNANKEQIDLGIPGQYQADVAKVALNLQREKNGQLGVSLNNPATIASNTAQTAKDIASPVVGAGLNAVTNQSFNGSQIRNPYASVGTQAAQTAINSASNALPIQLQNVVGANVQKHLPEALQGAISVSNNKGPTALGVAGNTLGLNPKADATTGNGPAINTYYQGQTSGKDYIAAHSGNTATQATNEQAFQEYYNRAKTSSGQTILLNARQSKANAALLASNPTVLAGVQVAEKANGKGNYDPTWDLPVTNKPGKPSLQTYQTYESLDDGDPNKTVMEQKDPWLINTFNQQQAYFNSNKFTSTAVAGSGYVKYPNISTAQSNLMTQVTNLSAIQNRTPDQENQLTTLEDNPSLQLAYGLIDKYTNDRRASEGLAPIPYPASNLTPAQSSLLTQEEALPSGTGAKTAFIKANQGAWNTVQNVLAQNTIYDVEKQGGVIQQGGIEPDFLKNTYEAGQYDIAAPASGTAASGYTLNPNLAYAQGSGSGSGSSSSFPLIALPKRPKYPKMAHGKKPYMAKYKRPKIRPGKSPRIQSHGVLNPAQVARPTKVLAAR